jgi:hypothetical protein
MKLDSISIKIYIENKVSLIIINSNSILYLILISIKRKPINLVSQNKGNQHF